MAKCGHRDPEQIARRVEERLAALDCVRHDFLAHTVEAHVMRDLVTVLLRFDVTPGEADLIERGSDKAVLELRYELQTLMEVDLVEAIEEEVERPVEVFTSANHLRPNVGVETFILGPAG